MTTRTVTVAFLGDSKQLQASMDEMGVSADAMAAEMGAKSDEVAAKTDAMSMSASGSFRKIGQSIQDLTGIPVNKVFDSLKKGFSDATSSGAGFSNALQKVGGVTALAAVAGVVAVGAASIDAAEKFDKAAGQYDVAAKANGESSKTAAGELSKTSASMVTLGFNSTDTASALTIVARITGDTATQTKIMSTAADVARAKNISLSEAAMLVGKATQGNIKGLAQLGINLNLGSAKAKTLASDQTALSNAGRTLAETQAKIAAGTLTGLAAQQALANAQDTVSQKQQKLTLDQRSGGAVLDAITAKTKGAANAYGQTLGGQMDVVRAQVHNLSTTFGEDLMPALDKVMNVGVKFLDYLMSHKVILAGIAILVGTVLVAAFIAWGVSVIAATWPILLIIAAIALLAAGVYEVVKHWDTIVDFFKKIWSDVEGVFRGPLGIILAILTPFISLPILIAMHWQQIVAFFESIWSDVVSGVERVISDVYTLFVALPEKLVTGLGDIVATVFGALLAAATWIDTNVLQPLVTYFVGLPVRLVTGLGNIVVTLWTKLLQSVTWIDTNVLQPIVSYFQQLPSRLATGLGDIVGTIFGGLATAWNWINTNVIGPIVTGFEGLPNDIANGIMSALGALSSIAKAILNPIIEGIDTAIDHINSVTGSIPVIGGSLHIPDIPALAAGGIVNSPTLAMIGEAGPEAVVPLSGSNGAGMGGSAGDTFNIYVTQSNATPQDIINAIRTYIQRNGSLKNAGIG